MTKPNLTNILTRYDSLLPYQTNVIRDVQVCRLGVLTFLPRQFQESLFKGVAVGHR